MIGNSDILVEFLCTVWQASSVKTCTFTILLLSFQQSKRLDYFYI